MKTNKKIYRVVAKLILEMFDIVRYLGNVPSSSAQLSINRVAGFPWPSLGVTRSKDRHYETLLFHNDQHPSG